ncbi:hypothetical protein P872_02365 [Rhodonellum psychrophilum GCM71 = DSM 17998]|uniref:Uncharacterized protein n=2 Tax=Rhodonellum TaxID=336827 RepID=U5C412_9BACT|nr:hypothetical protein P872_02365 [Rhodonellum psychrophilum GCM71 = DSM 17998]
MGSSCKNKPADPTVTYEVTTNNNNFDIYYLDGTGKEIHETITENYWTISFIGKKNDPVSLSVKANDLNDHIAAKIIYDGKPIKEVTTYGQKSGEKISAEISTKLPY